MYPVDPDPDPEHWILACTVRVPYVPVSVFRIFDGLPADPIPANWHNVEPDTYFSLAITIKF